MVVFIYISYTINMEEKLPHGGAAGPFQALLETKGMMTIWLLNKSLAFHRPFEVERCDLPSVQRWLLSSLLLNYKKTLQNI